MTYQRESARYPGDAVPAERLEEVFGIIFR
jgi:hypothetical protein